jgi:hypothetical protein
MANLVNTVVADYNLKPTPHPFFPFPAFHLTAWRTVSISDSNTAGVFAIRRSSSSASLDGQPLWRDVRVRPECALWILSKIVHNNYYDK